MYVQEVSLQDVRKEVNFCRKVNLPILGVVENMSGFVCPKCKVVLLKVCAEFIKFCFVSVQTESQIFPPSTGGAEKMAVDLSLPFLGKLPLDPRIGTCTHNTQCQYKCWKEIPWTHASLSLPLPCSSLQDNAVMRASPFSLKCQTHLQLKPMRTSLIVCHYNIMLC